MKYYKKRAIFLFTGILFIMLAPLINSLLITDLNVDLIDKYNQAHLKDDPNGLLPLNSKIISIKGTSNIQIIPDNPENTNYLKISSLGSEAGLTISTKQKKYNFLLSQTNSLNINAITSEIQEGSFSSFPYKKAEFIFEKGILKSKEGIKIKYTESNSELEMKVLDSIILKQNNLDNFNIDASITRLPVGGDGIYPLNAKLISTATSNFEYLGTSYEIPSNSEVKIIYGKLILPNGTKVKNFSPLNQDFLKEISETLGFKFNNKKMISFEGKNIDLGNGLLANIPEGASINFDNKGNMLIGHTSAEAVKFNNGIDIIIGGAKSQTEGVYIFKDINKAKASGYKNYINFGEDFEANLGDTSKSGGVRILFNRKNPYVPIRENAYFNIYGGRRTNEIASQIKIKRFESNKLAVADNKGFSILNDNTRSNVLFGYQGKAERLVMGGRGSDKEQVPILIRNHLDKESNGKPIQIASLYTDAKKRVFFTSNLEQAQDLTISNSLSYTDNFKPTGIKEIPFMQDVFEKNVQVTMDTVEMIKDNNFIDMYQTYKPNYKGLITSQKKYEQSYLDKYIDLAHGDEEKAKRVFYQAKAIVNNKKYDFKTRNNKLAQLYSHEFKIKYFPTLKNKDKNLKEQVAEITKFYYLAEKHGYLPSESNQFSLDKKEKLEIEKEIKNGKTIDQAIRDNLHIGPNVMFSDPNIPAQNWWTMFR